MKKLFRRVLDIRIILAYSLAYILLRVVNNESESVVEICGGIIGNHLSEYSPIQIMKWVLCTLPPIVVSTLFMQEEIGGEMTYVMIRAGTKKRWWIIHWYQIIVINLIYPILLLGFHYFSKIKESSAKIVLFFLVFEVHILTMSFLTVWILYLFKSPNWVVIFFGFIEIMLVIIGSISPHIAYFLFPFWGMYNIQNEWIEVNIWYSITTVGVSVMLLLVSVLGTLLYSNESCVYEKGEN